MARKAKDVAADGQPLNARTVNEVIRSVLSIHDEIETARGAFMNKCRRFREQIANKIEEGKARGIPAQAMRHLERIELAQRRLAKLALIEDEIVAADVKRVVEAHADPVQLTLFGFDAAPVAPATKTFKARKRSKGIRGDELPDNVTSLRGAADAAQEAASA